jgi:hypothetical protein
MSVANTAPQRTELSHTPVGRRLAVAWQHPDTRQISPVALLEFDSDTYRFRYIKNAASVKDFRPLLGFPDLHRAYESVHLFPLFAERVMDPRRPDYARYVRRLGLPEDATPWEQMSRSGGGRLGDLLQLFPEPEVRSDGTVVCTFLVHGVRHIPDRPLKLHGRTVTVDAADVEQRLTALSNGDPLQLVREPGNPKNPLAVVTATHDYVPLGWVPDLLLSDLYAMTGDNPEQVQVVAQQVNGTDAPAHLRLLAALSVRRHPAYRPFSGPNWEPLS